MNSDLKKFLGVSLVVIGLAVAGYVLVRATIYNPDDENLIPPGVATSSVGAEVITGATSTSPGKVAPGLYPLRLTIPKIDVDAAVQYVGITAKGNMGTPSNLTDVGWYKYGTVPGQTGRAVIAGHVDNGLSLPAVFIDLKKLVPGDDVYVTQKDGKQLHFKVDRAVIYGYKTAPVQEIFTSSDGKSHLVLITCAGTWVKADKTNDKRLVVYTTLVD